jgi:hypothetical protein
MGERVSCDGSLDAQPLILAPKPSQGDLVVEHPYEALSLCGVLMLEHAGTCQRAARPFDVPREQTVTRTRHAVWRTQGLSVCSRLSVSMRLAGGGAGLAGAGG